MPKRSLRVFFATIVFAGVGQEPIDLSNIGFPRVLDATGRAKLQIVATSDTPTATGDILCNFGMVQGGGGNRVLFTAASRPAATPCDDTGTGQFGVYEADGAEVRALLRDGDRLPGIPDVAKLLNVVADGERVLIGVTFADQSSGIVAHGPNGFELVVRSSDRAPTGESISPVIAFEEGPFFAGIGDATVFGAIVDNTTLSIFQRDSGGLRSLISGGRLPTLGQTFGAVDAIVASDRMLVFRAEDQLGLTALVGRRRDRYFDILAPGAVAPASGGATFAEITFPRVRGARVAFEARLSSQEYGLRTVWVWRRGRLRRMPGLPKGLEFYDNRFDLTRSGVVAVAGANALLATTQLVHWDRTGRRRILARAGDPVSDGESIAWIGNVSTNARVASFVAGAYIERPWRRQWVLAVPAP